MAEERLRAFVDANLTLLGTPFTVQQSSLSERQLQKAISSLNADLRESGHNLFSRTEQRRFLLGASHLLSANEETQQSGEDIQVSDLPDEWPIEVPLDAKRAYASQRARVAQLEERLAQAKLQVQRYAALASAISSLSEAGGGLLRANSALTDSLTEASQLVSQLRSRLTPETIAELHAAHAKRAAPSRSSSDLAAIQTMTKRARNTQNNK